MEDITHRIQRLVIARRDSLLTHLLTQTSMPHDKLTLLRQFVDAQITRNVQVIFADQFIARGSIDLGSITWNGKISLTFGFDGLAQILWIREPLEESQLVLIGLIDHELLHLPTSYEKDSPPLLLRVPVYIPKQKRFEDIGQSVENYMKDVFVDKWMIPLHLERFYDTTIIHQLLTFEYLTIKEKKGQVKVWTIKQKAIDFLNGKIVSLEFKYPWVTLFHNLYMYVTLEYHHLRNPFLDNIYRLWYSKDPELIDSIMALYQNVINQSWWRPNYIEEYKRINLAVRQFGYMEMELKVSLQASKYFL